MKLVADLHLHSYYSRATSKNLTPEYLHQWAQLKGVQVVGTGDISHPGWLQELQAKLEPAEEGLFRLKPELARAVEAGVPAACRAEVRFMLAGEISSIYKKNERVRKIHNVIFAPSFASVQKIQTALEKIGNIRSDGRPILGLDCRDLLEIILEIDPQNYLIPAHIWTPWFSLLGSKSGFDAVEECFGDLTPHIFALETGLSSDPPMNWRVSALDRYTLVSHSDAHSPQKLAREANIFNTERSYPALFAAMHSGSLAEFPATLEFFPEEGKYHFDGHRHCHICWEPQTTLAHQGRCPVCGKAVTVGVTHRVEMLADPARPPGYRPANARPFFSLIPLPEILGEVFQVGPQSKQVNQQFELLLTKLGPELAILQDIPLPDITGVGGPLLAEAIRRMRHGEVTISAGFDGQFGVIKLFNEAERDLFAGQLSFAAAPPRPARAQSPPLDRPNGTTATAQPSPAAPASTPAGPVDLLAGLNPEQAAAARWIDSPLLIVAGPGTGKTRTLTYRLAHLIEAHGVAPENMLAITFTHKAAQEMSERLTALLGETVTGQLTIKTFHAFGAQILRQAGQAIGLKPSFAICTDDDRLALLKQARPGLKEREAQLILEQISAAKNRLLTPDSPELADMYPDPPDFTALYRRYEAVLSQNQVLDFDDLMLRTVQLFAADPDLLAQIQDRFRWISVDEYQDLNFAQYHLLRRLTAPHTNLCAIGDPDQAIYGFRGADRGYFRQFSQDYPAAKTLRLTRNYRSTQLILEASGQVIAHNPDSRHPRLHSDISTPARVQIHSAPTEKAEAEYVVHEIEKMVGGTSYFSFDSQRVEDNGPTGHAFADFAVLYRLGAQSAALIEAFERSGMPYQTIGQRQWTDYREIKGILAYLWFIKNPNDAFHLGKILNLQKTVFDARVLNTLLTFADKRQMTAWNALMEFKELEIFTDPQKKHLAEVLPFLVELKAAEEHPVAELVERIAHHYLHTFNERQAERIQQLILRAGPFERRLRAFLESTTLQRETDSYDPRADRVTLMSLHAAKGLEFPVVFIIGCEETLLPYRRPGQPVELEEERRLFYVGLTRARQKLVLTHAHSRFLFGQTSPNPPSRFLSEIEADLKELQTSPRPAPTETPPASQLPLF
jgi:uncharacterized protein (TIGR00375 family)